MNHWHDVCALDDILPDSGVCARVDGRQVAVFRAGGELYALDNLDPASNANVLARGLVGDLKGEPVVASPVYKHHYSLWTGRCLEDPQYAVATYPIRCCAGRVELRARPWRVRAAGRARLVVVGNGMAAVRVLEELLERAPARYDITVFGAEPQDTYNRILLSPVLAGERRAEEIVTHPRAWYEERGISLHTGEEVVAIDRARRRVRTANGREVGYDRLLLATGSLPFVLDVPGQDLDGVLSFRNLADVEAMLTGAAAGGNAVVIGGGLLGLEAAAGLEQRGMTVTVVHLAAHLMERQLDAAAAGLLQESLEGRGIAFRLGASTAALEGEGAVEAVRLADGTRLPARLVVIAAGIQPNVALARAAGLQCRRGLLVDDTLQTFDPRVYAVGECVEHRNTTYGLVAPLYEQASVCARHLAEQGTQRYRGSVLATQLKVTGVELYSAGDLTDGDGREAIVLSDPRRGIYKRVVIDGDRLCGALLYGDTRDAGWYGELLASGRPLGALREQLLFGPDAAPAANAIGAACATRVSGPAVATAVGAGA
jgi:NAD(P)H-dependent nitrite reductase small subunit